jgi:glucose/mannose-6-phosphate isomerase
VTWVDPDSEHMLACSAALDEQVSGAVDAFGSLEGLPDITDLHAVVVMGMGGSAVAGEVLAAYSAPRSELPVVILNEAEGPRFLGPRTLLFAVSFSGNTEETLAVTETAISSGTPVVAVSTGGELEELAISKGLPFIPVAAAVPQPRAAAGATIVALLLAAEQLGMFGQARQDLAAAVSQLSLRRRDAESGGGVAREIARRIGRTIPLLHGAHGLGAVAARRWKTQINENAKSPAFFGAQPEVCHNEVCGFGQHGDVTRQILSLVNLRTGLEGGTVDRRFAIFAEMADEALASVIEVEGSGESELARFFDLVMIGDFVSLHLAASEGIDPGPVPALVEMKQRLAAGS